MVKKGRGILLVYADIDEKDDEEFNAWYTTEHLPGLLAIPGFLDAARYVATSGGPKYLAAYELESADVARSPALANRPRSDWDRRMSPRVIGKNFTRIVGEQIYPDAVEQPDRGMAPALQIGRMSIPASLEAEWTAWYNGEYIPGYRTVPGVIYARRYRVLEGDVGFTTVYEFEHDKVSQSDAWRDQWEHSSPRSNRMRDAMTHAPGSPGVYRRIDA